MYTSKHFTCEEIDQRLLQGYYDDFVKAGFVGTINEFHNFVLSIKDKVSKDDLKNLEIEIPKKVSAFENDANYQTKEEVVAMINSLVDGAGSAMDTLKELADALNNDPNFATTITNKLTEFQSKLNEEVARAKEAEAKLETELGKVDDHVTEVNQQMESHFSTISSALQNAVNNLNTRIDSFYNYLDSTQNKINELSSKIDGNSSELKEYAKGLVDAEAAIARGAEQANKEAIQSLSQTHQSDKSDTDIKITQETSERKSADSLLENKITELTGTVAANKSEQSQALNTEVSERKLADVELQGKIDTEVSERKLADIELGSQIAQEVSERKAEDNLIHQSISNLENSVSENKTDIESKLADEAEARRVADEAKVDKKEGYGLSKNDFTDTLLQKLNAIEAHANYITHVSQLINDSNYQTKDEVETMIQEIIGSAPDVLNTLEEISKALADDPNFATTITNKLTALATQLNTEVSERKSEDTRIENKITEQVSQLNTNLTEQITEVSDDLAQEVSERKAKDAELTGLINTEKTDRTTQYTELSNRLRGLATNLSAQIQAIQSALDNAKIDLGSRISAQDAAIQSNTANIQRNLELIQGISGNIGSQYTEIKELLNTEIQARKDADSILQQGIDQMGIALQSEIQARKDADKQLQDSITQETTSREETDIQLQTNLDQHTSKVATDSELGHIKVPSTIVHGSIEDGDGILQPVGNTNSLNIQPDGSLGVSIQAEGELEGNAINPVEDGTISGQHPTLGPINTKYKKLNVYNPFETNGSMPGLFEKLTALYEGLRLQGTTNVSKYQLKLGGLLTAGLLPAFADWFMYQYLPKVGNIEVSTQLSDMSDKGVRTLQTFLTFNSEELYGSKTERVDEQTCLDSLFYTVDNLGLDEESLQNLYTGDFTLPMPKDTLITAIGKLLHNDALYYSLLQNNIPYISTYSVDQAYDTTGGELIPTLTGSEADNFYQWATNKFTVKGRFKITIKGHWDSTHPGTFRIHSWDSNGDYKGYVTRTITTDATAGLFEWEQVFWPSFGETYFAIDVTSINEVQAFVQYDYASSSDANKEGSIRSLYESMGAVYNESTGLYSLNGLDDLTAAEMAEIYNLKLVGELPYQGAFAGTSIRTNMTTLTATQAEVSMHAFATNNAKMVVADLTRDTTDGEGYIRPTSLYAAFNHCQGLKTILGVINADKITSADLIGYAFNDCGLLEDVRIQNLAIDVSFRSCPNITLETLRYIVDHATNTSQMNIYINQVTYDTFSTGGTEWSTLLTEANAKNIYFPL